ncbi:MAG: hypothetical protein LQ341_002126, partial [Variospora aurantia]
MANLPRLNDDCGIENKDKRGPPSPQNDRSFPQSINDVGWHGSAYLMTQLALQPTFGKLYILFNIKSIYIGALLIFELCSTTCAAAPSSIIIIILGRAISGAGLVGTWCGAFTIGTNIVPLRRKSLYICIVTSMYGVAAAGGPLLGWGIHRFRKADMVVLLLALPEHPIIPAQLWTFMCDFHACSASRRIEPDQASSSHTAFLLVACFPLKTFISSQFFDLRDTVCD